MDTVANMICAIYNAQVVGKANVIVPFSRLKFQIAKVLEENKLVSLAEKKSHKINKSGKLKPCLEITLKYKDGIGAISGFRKVSRPGQRIYKGSNNLRKIKQGQGLAVLSTSKGIITDKQSRQQNVGGEVLCEIW